MMCARAVLVKCLCLLALLIAPPLAQGATIRVPLNQPTIESGLFAASEGDTVLVAAGTYTGVGNWYIWFPEAGITLLSEAGPLHTIIDGGGNWLGCMTISNNSGALIEGFTFQNGRGAISISHYSTPVIRNCVFRDLRASETTGDVYGGAVRATQYSESVFENCLFVHNQVSFTGDPYAGMAKGGALSCLTASLHLVECTIIENEAITNYGAGGQGGALYGYDAELQLTGCSVYGNDASGDGGGIYLANCSTTIENSIIAFSSSGEGIFCLSNADISVACSDIFGNEGGDWIDCIGDQLGINGNISEDPIFCNAPSDTLTIRSDSPCAPENSPPGCGLIGAWPVGCATTTVGPLSVSSARGRLTIRPNPVLGRASFLFDVQGSSTAIEIYDPQGRLIKMLTGSERVEWLPSNAVPSGAYFARLRGRGTNEIVKFIVLK